VLRINLQPSASMRVWELGLPERWTSRESRLQRDYAFYTNAAMHVWTQRAGWARATHGPPISYTRLGCRLMLLRTH